MAKRRGKSLRFAINEFTFLCSIRRREREDFPSRRIRSTSTMTIPYKNQVPFNGSDFEIKARMDNDTFGPVNKTLDQFAGGYDDLVKIIRKFMIKF